MPDSKRKTIIESIREYVRMYPDIDNRKINIDYLGDGMEYSIDPIGVDPIYKRYAVYFYQTFGWGLPEAVPVRSDK